MSRIGKLPVEIPQGVDVKIANNVVSVKGPGGLLEKSMHPDMIIEINDGILTVKRPTESKLHKSLHGLTRSLINNMVIGVSKGYEKTLEIHGVGYRAQKQGKKLVLNLGYSHLIEMEEAEGITFDVPAANRIIVKGIDKQRVGEFAAKIRDKRKPEVYLGKGVRYANEIIKLKEGKSGAKG